MSAGSAREFEQQYLSTWTESDADRRRALIEQTWAVDGRLAIAPMGLVLDGVDAIAQHVANVNQQNIVERGMRFVYDQQFEAADALVLRWSMLTADGQVAGRGVDVVFRDAAGRAQTVYMVMGVD